MIAVEDFASIQPELAMRHTLILVYFSSAEVERYKMLARVLASWPRTGKFEVSCLLCSVVSGIEEDPELRALFSAVMPTETFRCQTTVVGYPERPTAMFWEIMGHVANTDNYDGGFAVWFEADMVPTRPSWLEDLHCAWLASRRPIVMGRLQPRSYSPAVGALISRHINGGACYAKRYAREIPASFKTGTFDLSPWSFLRRSGAYVATSLFEYGTLARLDVQMKSTVAVLHAYRQDKAAFYQRWSDLVLTGASLTPHDPSAPCCDLFTKHLLLTYCPIHSERTRSVRLVNSVSVAVATPIFSARRRWRLLSQRIRPSE